MIAMRYGMLPVVRGTGGLADTVLDVTTHPERGTGFVFEPFTVEALLEALGRALEVYQNPTRWQTIQERAMRMDFSWSSSARTYTDLYRRALALHGSLLPPL